jgi:hypothetical protein
MPDKKLHRGSNFLLPWPSLGWIALRKKVIREALTSNET